MRAGELAEVGRDVGPLLPGTVDAADATGRHDAQPGGARDRERPADRCRADGALDASGGEIARADLARVRAEPLQLLRPEADPHDAVEDADRRRHGAGVADAPLGLEPDRRAFARREAVRDERCLERDDGLRVAHLVRDDDHVSSSICTNSTSPNFWKLRMCWPVSRNPARS